MKRTFSIDVTQEDIDSAFINRRHGISLCHKCPIDLAASRALQVINPDSVVTGIASIQVCIDGESYYGSMPRDARDFVSLYDGWNNVEPFSFPLTLDLPESA